jgi:hypothetical protein
VLVVGVGVCCEVDVGGEGGEGGEGVEDGEGGEDSYDSDVGRGR